MTPKKYYWNDLRHFRSGRDFLWTVPVGHVVLLVIPGVVLAAVNWLCPGRVSLRAGSWLLATLAIWAALLRVPLYGACYACSWPPGSVGRSAARSLASCGIPGMARYVLAGSLGLLVVLAALSSGRQAVREYLAVPDCRRLRRARATCVLIVWDTVRASQPEPLRLSPEHHPQPGAVGPEGQSGTARRCAQPPGRTRRIAASSPASGLASSIPCGITSWTPQTPRLPSTWPRGAIRPPGSRRTPTTVLTRPGWIGASLISRITR